MSLLFIDSFGHYDYNHLGDKYESFSGNIAIVTGRNGNCLRIYHQAYVIKSLDNYYTTLTVGFAFYTSNISQDTNFLRFLRDGTVQDSLSVTGAGNIVAYRRTGDWLAQTNNSPISANTWNYIEAQLFINDSGYFKVRINGDLVINYSGDTKYYSDSWMNTANQIQFYVPYSSYNYFDDLYILNNSGSINNDFLGDVRVDAIFPNGDGNSTEFTPVGAGSNYLCVDDTTAPDDDTTYVTSSGINDLDLYTYGNLSTGAAEVYGIQAIPLARKDNAGEVDLDLVVRTNGSNSTEDTNAMTDSYIYYPTIIEQNPITVSGWTISEINALEVGVNRSE